jgi:AGCS family alanine or glycine:cation symporter
VCSLTAFVILASGAWRGRDLQGAQLTSDAFVDSMGPLGAWILIVAVVLFGVSTMIGFSYYGRKCFSYLFGAERARWYDGIYLVGLFLGALWSAQAVIDLIDTMFALMALPNMIATLALAPRVMTATRDYFGRMKRAE